MRLQFRKTTGFVVLSFMFLIQSLGQSGSDIARLFKPSYGNWKLSDKIQEYNPDNLYDLINGAADSYLSFNFSDLLVRTYETDPEHYINVEIYNHQNLPNAFGIYISERPGEGSFLKIGIQGYHETGLVNFFTDKYYVKISTHNTDAETQEVLKSIASDISQILGGGNSFPKELSFFPELNKVLNSESYTNTNFLGYEFLKSAYIASYSQNNKHFKIFIMSLESRNAAENALKQYSEKIKASFNGSEGRYEFTDPHNGTIKLEWKENYIWGLLNENNVKIKEDYLQLVKEKLLQNK